MNPKDEAGRALSPWSATRTLLRSFLIQGSWNYRTMLGSGFGFAMVPGLREIYGADSTALNDALGRHVEHFNTHPYLSGLALGAALRLESDGADPDTIRRFKVAVRGPLGGIGDALVWATWLPGVALAALSLHWLGAPAWLSVGFFLVSYNVGHLGLRVWGLRQGLRAGREVGGVLTRADLGGRASQLGNGVALFLGILAGAVLGGGGGLAESGVFWVVAAAVAFWAGLIGGHRTWRPAAAVIVIVVAMTAGYGVLG